LGFRRYDTAEPLCPENFVLSSRFSFGRYRNRLAGIIQSDASTIQRLLCEVELISAFPYMLAQS